MELNKLALETNPSFAKEIETSNAWETYLDKHKEIMNINCESNNVKKEKNLKRLYENLADTFCEFVLDGNDDVTSLDFYITFIKLLESELVTAETTYKKVKYLHYLFTKQNETEV